MRKNVRLYMLKNGMLKDDALNLVIGIDDESNDTSGLHLLRLF
ncbi:hypothetical protein RF679_03280 [Undibacterium cyanobacteriorum]|uniref:Uncharacterized protein n=1 Tax=Undibacterium cyanobacteriorum TaxID=3073561 RepID=A0ABY9RKE8_9BURK|nr:hypothetical protein [Undibacterium sp. 20NA77.5]WMW81313.1 hypothetical protein RF679_03280 [Undibacterium sp. 20NA77.5]